MRWQHRSLFIALLLWFGWAAAAPLETCSRPLTVGYYLIPPLYFKTHENPVWRGVDKDVIDELARRTGCTFVPRFESRVRIWAQLESGQLDLTVSGIPTPERERFATFLIYLQTRNMLAIRRDDSRPPQTAKALAAAERFTLATTRGYRYGPPFEAWIVRLAATNQIVETADEEAALHLLSIGRVDGAIVRESAWEYYASEFPAGSLRLVDMEAPYVPAGLAMSREHIGEGLRKTFAEAIAAMKRDGTLLKIAERHVSGEASARLVSF
ncbi:hypothetical protein GCM10025771_24540 [Niveibacterium umoris]|uniref:Polar amino acid transport system substrate-binding protein n=1 Tax=Niveibacterium umoris TaxID=1193620 RepID=A0A840BPJ8_9RHOO|nr:transporter substrate-binding domain-containing protein [Niveibacterium umoris]MBB4012357.1 polar amino acid transport system substrate-binding protein [Niveibacterium umoris]